MSTYTRRKAKAKYRERIRFESVSQKQSSDTRKTPYERVKRWRERKRMKAYERIIDDTNTSAAGTPEPMQNFVTEDIKIEEHEIDYACVKSEEEECTPSTSNPLEFENINIAANDQGDAEDELPIKIEEHNIDDAFHLQYTTDIKIEDEEVTFQKNTSPTSSTVELQNLNFIDANYSSDIKIELDRPEKIKIVRPEYLFVSDVSATTNTSAVDNYNELNNKSVQVDMTKEEINEHQAQQIKLLQMKVMKLNLQLKFKDEALKELQEKVNQCQCDAKRTDVKNTMEK